VNTPPNLDPTQPPSSVTIAPGRYPALDVKSSRTLRLTAGEYFLDGLMVESGGGLQIDGSGGPVFVYIQDGGFTFRGSMAGGVNTPGMPVPSLTVMTTGSVTAETPFTGVLIAPNGSVSLKGNFANHQGAVFARNITIFENNRIFHYRDPYSFRGFGPTDPNVAIGDRASVTGGSIRRPVADVTDEANQTESVSAVSRNGTDTFITVGYNDFTTSPLTTSIQYTDFTVTGDARDGNGRLVNEFTSLMGWSFSTDGGRTFTYGGRVPPPQNWSIIWGDPAIAKASIDDPNVYYAQMSGTTTKFRSGWDPILQAVLGPVTDAVLDGHCVARSTDRGRTFPIVKCTSGNFQDGTALAVAIDSNNRRKVYLIGSKAVISRLDGDSMTFDNVTYENPIVAGPNQELAHHPRMRVYKGILYVARLLLTGRLQDGTAVAVNRLNAFTNSTTWMGQVNVATNVSNTKIDLGDGRVFALGDEFSFDLGPDANGVDKLRVMYVATDTNPTTPGSRVEVRECDLDLTNCRTTGWSTAGNAGDEVDPNLRFGGGRWVAAWRERDPGAVPNTVHAVAGQLNTGISGVEALVQRSLTPNIVPCTFGAAGFSRLGEYDHIDALGDGRFFAPYPVSGPGCRWHGLFTSDTHISGTVFGF
ncbi:MAG TPA: hypothetical protein VN903_37210, partial [Polyangia bacterium]|nr:hypothetical protein [Polyangia bacterium]